jgi:preprotein translocase subunit SecG
VLVIVLVLVLVIVLVLVLEESRGEVGRKEGWREEGTMR